MAKKGVFVKKVDWLYNLIFAAVASDKEQKCGNSARFAL
jgi:hypothetical protein